MTTTIGMWEMVSELLEGEKLPVSMNEAIEGLCNGDLVIAERHEFRKLESDNHALKAQIDLLKKAQAEIENLKRANRHEHIVAENALKEIEALKLSLSGNSAQVLSKNEETLPNGNPA